MQTLSGGERLTHRIGGVELSLAIPASEPESTQGVMGGLVSAGSTVV